MGLTVSTVDGVALPRTHPWLAWSSKAKKTSLKLERDECPRRWMRRAAVQRPSGAIRRRGIQVAGDYLVDGNLSCIDWRRRTLVGHSLDPRWTAVGCRSGQVMQRRECRRGSFGFIVHWRRGAFSPTRGSVRFWTRARVMVSTSRYLRLVREKDSVLFPRVLASTGLPGPRTGS